MKPTDLVQSRRQTAIFPSDVCAELWAKLDALPEPYWVLRDRLGVHRGTGSGECHYWICGDKGLPKTLTQEIRSLAPKLRGFDLAELMVNRYNVGDYIGEHRDRHHYFRNLVIPLQANGDGLFIEDVWVEDEAGTGFMFEGIGPVHHVPPVKHKRYCVIFLYE